MDNYLSLLPEELKNNPMLIQQQRQVYIVSQLTKARNIKHRRFESPLTQLKPEIPVR